ncbi:A24 family peptidase [Cohnella nanjingensis]|uniref:Prepilin peptidase n=1 Tax=Cohnella nanjingensis TaxID=1387779 RepID=A0A7X0VI34_9BACL|nr:prepilin peptidase [Cohnella nanjingensis]MBB6674785.1 prepilin peptidase [Cohnella nanjingensis]
MNAIEWAATVVLLGAACWTDLRRMEIPNGLTVSFAAAGLLYQVIAHGYGRIGWTLGGVAAGMLPLLLLYALRGIGGGDVKWFAAFGAWAGAAMALQLVVGSVLCAGAIALLLMAMRLPGVRTAARRLKWPWGEHPSVGRRGARFPFMLAVAPAYVALFWSGWSG